jgi:hypothetical protein
MAIYQPKPDPPCVRVYVMRANETGFWLYFYGLTQRDLMVIPNQYITTAMQRRGLEPGAYSLSPFMVESVRPQNRNYVMESMVGRMR